MAFPTPRITYATKISMLILCFVLKSSGLASYMGEPCLKLDSAYFLQTGVESGSVAWEPIMNPNTTEFAHMTESTATASLLPANATARSVFDRVIFAGMEMLMEGSPSTVIVMAPLLVILLSVCVCAFKPTSRSGGSIVMSRSHARTGASFPVPAAALYPRILSRSSPQHSSCTSLAASTCKSRPMNCSSLADASLPHLLTFGSDTAVSFAVVGTKIFSPLVRKVDGSVFQLKGFIKNHMQKEILKVTCESGEPYAVVHINESEAGCGVLVEMHPRRPVAFFDTQFAVGEHAMGKTPKVAILQAGLCGWDPTMEPVAEVRPAIGNAGEIVVSIGGAPALTVKLDANGQVVSIVTAPGPNQCSRVVALIDGDATANVRPLSVAHGMDPVLVMCAVVAATKVGRRQAM